MNNKLRYINPSSLQKAIFAHQRLSSVPNVQTASFSTEGEPEPPKKSFNPLKTLSKAIIFSTIIGGGVIYFSEDARKLTIDQYPPSKEAFDFFDNNVGFYKPSPPEIKKSFDATDTFPITEAASTLKTELKPSLIVENKPAKAPEVSKKHSPDVESEIGEVITRTELSVNRAINDLFTYKKAIQAYLNALKDLKKVKDKNLQSTLNKVEELNEKLDLERQRSDKSVQNANEELGTLNLSIQTVNSDKQLSTSDLSEKMVGSYNKFKYSLDTTLLDIKRSRNDLSAATKSSDLMKSLYKAIKTDINDVVSKASKIKPENRSLSDANSLLMLAEERMKAMEARVLQAEKSELERLEEAMTHQKQLDEEFATANLSRELERLKNEMAIERHSWKRETEEKIEQELNNALARHGEQLSQVLKMKEAEMENQFEVRKRELITKEQESFEAAIRTWIKRMEAIEKVVDGRADSDRVARETQSIWLTVENLASAMNFPSEGDGSHTGPLETFVNKVLSSTNKDSEQYRFAKNLLEKMSDDCVSQGVWTAQGLRSRFEKVYSQCRSVASIEPSQMSLWAYIKGSLKSYLLFDSLSIGEAKDYVLDENSELANDQKVSPYRVLTSCRKAVNQGNFLLAIKLLNLLDGQASLVAADWIKDARNYLEAQMISKTLLAYASAQGHDSLNCKA